MADVNTGAAPAPAATPSNTPNPTPVDAAAPVDANVDAADLAVGAEGTPSDAEGKPVTKAEKKAEAARKKYKLKIDGKDEDFDFDPSNEEEVIKHLQLSKVSHKRMQESAEMRKGIQELLDTLRTDPLKVLGDPRLQIPEETRKKMAEAIINNELEEMSKTPEQKEKEKLQKEYERLKQEVENEKKAREEVERARLTEQQAIQLDNEITGAIEKAGLPKNARTVRYMAEALMFCLQNNLDLSAQDLVPYVKKQTLAEFKEIIGSLPDDEFEGWVGKERLTSIRKKNLPKNKIPDSISGIKPTGVEAAKPADNSKKIPIKDFMKSLGR